MRAVAQYDHECAGVFAQHHYRHPLRAGAPPDELTSRVASLSESQYPPLGVKHIIAQLAGDGVPHRCGGAGCATYLFNTKSCADANAYLLEERAKGSTPRGAARSTWPLARRATSSPFPRESISTSHADAVERGGLLALYGPTRAWFLD